MSKADIPIGAATDSNFGISAARADSWMMGVETQLPEADLTIGVRNDYALSGGAVSLMDTGHHVKGWEPSYMITNHTVPTDRFACVPSWRCSMIHTPER